VVVKKTFRYANVFFYNHLYPNSVKRFDGTQDSGLRSKPAEVVSNQGAGKVSIAPKDLPCALLNTLIN